MFRAMNPAVTRTSKHSTQNHESASRENCILCRVLWPTILQHRHLPVDPSSEATTLLVSPKKPFRG